MDTPEWSDQQKFTLISSMRTERWPIGTDGERDSRKSLLFWWRLMMIAFNSMNTNPRPKALRRPSIDHTELFSSSSSTAPEFWRFLASQLVEYQQNIHHPIYPLLHRHHRHCLPVRSKHIISSFFMLIWDASTIKRKRVVARTFSELTKWERISSEIIKKNNSPAFYFSEFI